MLSNREKQSIEILSYDAIFRVKDDSNTATQFHVHEDHRMLWSSEVKQVVFNSSIHIRGSISPHPYTVLALLN